MRAEAIVEVERRAGRDVVTRLRSDPPLSLRQSADAVYVVGSGAGPLGGDQITLRVWVGAGAALVLRSVAASIVLPSPVPARSVTTLDVEVAAGGHLDLSLEPQIVAAGADHLAHTRICLASGASLYWRDEVVLGRHAEAGGSLVQDVRVTVDGEPVLATAVALGQDRPGSLGPAGIDGARALGTLLQVGGCASLMADPAPTVDGARGAVFVLGGGATLGSVLSASAPPVRRWLDAVTPVTAGGPRGAELERSST